jgi:ferredoxin
MASQCNRCGGTGKCPTCSGRDEVEESAPPELSQAKAPSLRHARSTAMRGLAVPESVASEEKSKAHDGR